MERNYSTKNQERNPTCGARALGSRRGAMNRALSVQSSNNLDSLSKHAGMTQSKVSRRKSKPPSQGSYRKKYFASFSGEPNSCLP